MCAFLIAGKAGYVVPGIHLEFESATVGLRGEIPDLIDNGKVFCASGEKDMSEELPVTPARQGKAQAPDSRRFPRRAGAGERAAGARSGQGKSPFTRKIEKSCAVQCENPRGLIPIPMLVVSKLEAADEIPVFQPWSRSKKASLLGMTALS